MGVGVREEHTRGQGNNGRRNGQQGKGQGQGIEQGNGRVVGTCRQAQEIAGRPPGNCKFLLLLQAQEACRCGEGNPLWSWS